jgi:hypothetical protein
VREGQWQKTQTNWSLHKGECDARCCHACRPEEEEENEKRTMCAATTHR